MDLESFNPLEVYKYTIYEDEDLGKRLTPVLFIDTTNTIKEKCNNNIEEATHLENRIGSNNKILDIRNFKFYVEDRKIFDNKGNLITDIVYDSKKEYFISDAIEVIFIPQFPKRKYFTKETYDYFIKICEEKNLEVSFFLYDYNVAINSFEEIRLNLEDKKYSNLKDIK
jgi:hypothetical protein